MQALNFSRQVIREFSALLSRGPAALDMGSWAPEALRLGLEGALVGVKFQLPEGGRILEDVDYRALDPDEPLRLPFPRIALEYLQHSGAPLLPGQLVCSKRVAFCRETDDGIRVLPVVWADEYRCWLPLPEVRVPRTGYLDRSNRDSEGLPAINVFMDAGTGVAGTDCADEVGAVLSLLNALACSNVRAERIEQKQPKRAKQGALPFDSFHILTIEAPGGRDGNGGRIGSAGHRSPREHLRRGHIRRYESGLKVWVNATVVNPGQAVVGKAYRMKGQQEARP